jgi:short-subunit dehydrogenase
VSSQSPTSRVVVITGASSGVGHATAVAFAETRASVVLAARSADVLESVADACRLAGGAALAVPTDVSEADDVERLARMAVAEFGRIDVWVNNAGVAALGRFEEVPLRDHTQVIKTDLLGTIYGSAVALRQFRAQGGGTLINIASVLGEIPAPYYASYVAAKHGVVGLGAALRQEIAKNDESDIHVCTVLPMAMETPFFENAANYTGHEATPIPPVYDPQDAVKTILRLTEKPEAEVVVGGAGKVATAFHAVAAGVTEKLMGTEVQQVQMNTPPPAPATSGNLHMPSAETSA